MKNHIFFKILFVISTFVSAKENDFIDINLDETRPKYVTNLGIMPYPDSYLHIYALPVGDGDATLIQCPGGELIVIDMGTSSTGAGWSSYQVKTWMGNNVDLVSTIIVTKGSADHYNYIPSVFQSNMNINRIILGGKKDDYSSETFMSWINQRTHVLEYVNGQEPCITNCRTAPPMCQGKNETLKFRFLGANLGSDADGRSLLLQLSARSGAFKMFFPGDFEGTDIENLVMNEWIWMGESIKSTHYKISNRGDGKKSNSFDFLKAINPKYAFTSSKYPSTSSGPECSTITRLLSLGSIGKRSRSGNYACFNSNANAIMQYTSWVYNIYSTSPYPNQNEILQIDVPIYS
nr:Hexaxilin-2 [Euplectella curvistellata]